MNVLLLTHNHPDRGSYFRALEIARRFAQRGHFVELWVCSDRRKYRGGPLAVERVPAAPGERDKGHLIVVETPNWTLFNDSQEGWSAVDWAFRSRNTLRQRWDLVYTFSHKPSCYLPALIARQRGAKVLADWADLWGGPDGLFRAQVETGAGFRSLPFPIRAARRGVFRLDALLEPRILRMADGVTLISEELLKLDRAPRGLAEKSLVLHSGAPLDAIRPADKAASRQEWRLPDDGPEGIVFGYAANYHTDERLLLEAFAAVLRELPQARLLVAGAAFENMTGRLAQVVAPRLTHCGRIPFNRMASFLGAADILLLPLSDIPLNRVRYPHKLSDYLAAGRPVIACEVGETGTLLRRYQFGERAAPTVAGLASAMMALARRREEWGALGSLARLSAEKHFDWNILCGRLFGFLTTQLNMAP